MQSFGFAVMLATILMVGGCGQSRNSPTEQERLILEPPEPTATLEGIWFTNFENSRFLECSGRSCGDRPLRDWASVACSDRSCEMLDREARRIARVHGGGAPSGSFHIRFIGRRSTVKHEPRYLGDGEGEVWVERLLDMRLASDDL